MTMTVKVKSLPHLHGWGCKIIFWWCHKILCTEDSHSLSHSRQRRYTSHSKCQACNTMRKERGSLTGSFSVVMSFLLTFSEAFFVIFHNRHCEKGCREFKNTLFSVSFLSVCCIWAIFTAIDQHIKENYINFQKKQIEFSLRKRESNYVIHFQV